MILEELQDQAALYALGMLEGEERARFEATLRSNAELRAMVRELREAAADLARSVPSSQPPAELKQQILQQIEPTKRAGPAFNWIPWAIAALFLLFCGGLALDRARLQREVAEARAADPFAKATFVSLTSPSGDFREARVIVIWEPDQQTGVITISHLPPAGAGHDYQLWTVDAQHKEPINTGLIHVEPSGVARIRFKPEATAFDVKAFAISLEREGGVPKREGPIILLGNA
jgi:anti-sigma-K factor RskA